ncbi:DUF3592 domain-containing protein [Allorhizobium taibaishanense]|uniref:DUF3592 domain-containing protein n=1 Tax=Allorhizobium taibaishanense TaxID=887144 RepID=A0A1Q8ZZN8_9HYPH|nr:DUF3592 domain-containing protein [Allorhizobium taibaishanense]MBB4007215.1 hypothetical protein [Allorhizobium taibaishanense]OLP47774.1 hypothetical protein BJF91_05270 [Allorhizobium taibaishanense]
MGKIMTWIGYVFTLIGLAFLVTGGWLFYSDHQFAARAIHAPGVVTDLARKRGHDDDGTTFTAIVQFTDANGQSQEMADSISANPPRFSKGDKVDVLYDPQAPSSAVINDGWGRYFLPGLFSGLGFVFAIIGGTFLVIIITRNRKRIWLQRFGRPVDADFLHVYLDRSVEINGAHPFRVVAQGPDPQTGQLQRYQSEPIWVDPTAQLEGRKLKVLVDPQKPARHFVDLSPVLGKQT